METGHLLGRVHNPVGGELLNEVRAGRRGVVLTVRAYPLVHAQELLVRIAGCLHRRAERGVDAKTPARPFGRDVRQRMCREHAVVLAEQRAAALVRIRLAAVRLDRRTHARAEHDRRHRACSRVSSQKCSER